MHAVWNIGLSIHEL